MPAIQWYTLIAGKGGSHETRVASMSTPNQLSKAAAIMAEGADQLETCAVGETDCALVIALRSMSTVFTVAASAPMRRLASGLRSSKGSATVRVAALGAVGLGVLGPT